MAAPVLQEEPGHLAIRLRDRAGLLRLMDKHSNPQQSSEGTAILLEEAAYQIDRAARIYIDAVKGRQTFRMHFARLREVCDTVQSLIHNLPRSATADQIDKILNEALAPRSPDET